MASETATPQWAERPATIRSELVRRISADLLGPLDGDDEVIRGFQREDGTWTPSGRVNDRYLAGKLAPAGTVARDPERTDDPGTGDEDPARGSHDGQVAQRVLAQSSMGLTAVVPADTDELIARCRWGSYSRQDEPHPDGSNARVWQRRQIDLTVAIPIREGDIEPLPVNDEGVVVRARATRAKTGSLLLATVFLCNEQEPVAVNKDSRWLFQASLDLSATNGKPVFCGREELPLAQSSSRGHQIGNRATPEQPRCSRGFPFCQSGYVPPAGTRRGGGQSPR